jgi:hypothetical protein
MPSNTPNSDTPPSAASFDPVVEAYKVDVDRTLLRRNLQFTVDERFQQFASFMQYYDQLREAGRRLRNSRQR